MAGIIRKVISTASAPKPVGPYSQAVQVNDTMYISGQLGLDPVSGNMVSGGVEGEAAQTMKNLQAVLQAAGGDMGNLVKTTILLSDINDWPKVNAVYEKYFSSKFPARAAYQVSALPKGAKVEIEAVAVLGAIEDKD